MALLNAVKTAGEATSSRVVGETPSAWLTFWIYALVLLLSCGGAQREIILLMVSSPRRW